MKNVILILSDSLNRGHVSAYGNSPVQTPNLDRLASRGYRFDNHFVGSLPCMPARRELFTGRQEFLWRPWGPLEPFDHRLPQLLQHAGLSTAIVTDHHHYWNEPGNGYLQSFGSAELIRGQEGDFWKPSVPAGEPVPQWVASIERWRPSARRFYANVRDFQTEEDFFTARTVRAAQEWLRCHADQRPFYLQVELFDVHEPFYVPEPYRSMFWEGDSRNAWQQYTVWPPYSDPEQQAEFMAQATDEELRFIRAQYAGKVAMLDHWLGKLFDTLDEQGRWADTMVIFTTDHGHDLGERGVFAKSYPHYDSHANIPLLVWHPDYPGAGAAVEGLTSTVDLFATILEAAGAEVPADTESQSILPLLRDGQAAVRDACLYGTFGQGICYTDGDWTLFVSPVADARLYCYSTSMYCLRLGSGHCTVLGPPDACGLFIPGVEIPQWRIPVSTGARQRASMLFHRSDDPRQTQNLWLEAPAERTRLVETLRECLATVGCPPEQYERLGLGRPNQRRSNPGKRMIFSLAFSA